MLHILLVSVRREGIEEFAEALSSDPEVRLDQVTSGADAICCCPYRMPSSGYC